MRLAATLAISLIAALAAALSLTIASAHPPETIGVERPFTNENPVCSEFGLPFELKVDPGVSGQYSDGTLDVDVTVNSNNVVSWTSNLGVDLVIVKGGTQSGGNTYAYNPEAKSDSGLHAAGTAPTYQGVSHISFCYDIELEVSKTASTSFTRDFDWTIVKRNLSGSSAADPLVIQENQPINVDYEIVVTKDSGTDSGWAVTGTISVVNPHPTAAARGLEVTDVISGGTSAAVDCDPNAAGDQSTGLTIAAGGTLECTYSAELPDGSARTNTATATTTTAGIGAGTGTAPVTFGNPSTVLDNCVDISDTLKLSGLGQVCASRTFTYTLTFNTTGDPLPCGPSSVENTATLATDDGQPETSSSTVWFDKQCDQDDGCTLTQGYWKTHSVNGPAKKSDPTWNLVGGPGASFFVSGKTWYQVFWSPPANNAYYVLAHQYMAAKLNILAGASAPQSVLDALAAAQAFFTTANPATRLTNAKKAELTALAGTLASYNEGASGPGHCDGDTTS